MAGRHDGTPGSADFAPAEAAGGAGCVPRVTVAVPSHNQGRFLDASLRSIFAEPVEKEVMLADAGSTDETSAVIDRWRSRLTWWRSAPDPGQAAAINEAIARGRAPFVCWLGSDDMYLPGGLAAMLAAMDADSTAAVVYGGAVLIDERDRVIGRYRVADFSPRALSRRSIIAQVATLIRREAWQRVGGLDEKLCYSIDYDLWWRLQRDGARFVRIDADVAAMRLHAGAKSISHAAQMYTEGKSVVRRHLGSLPLIWRLREPFSVGARREGSSLAMVIRAWRRWTMRA